jgi:oxygen-independent coproporphyrinogen-3 oxidase
MMGGRRLRGGSNYDDSRKDAPEHDASGYVAPRALYVHVPICASKCAYCDFFSLPISAMSGGFETELVKATLDRASRLAERFGADAFDTVYVGGGTPTMLSPSALDSLLQGISTLVAGARGGRPVEWTVEANPESLRPDALDSMARHGVTRLSIGVQSLDPIELELLGRVHGPDEALSALRSAADRGMAVSADLIAGIPWGKKGRGGSRDLDRHSAFAQELIDAGAGHVSVYDLSLEEGTPLAVAAGSLSFPTEDENWEMRQRLETTLKRAGMRRYEVSNYAPSGSECRHNLVYWRMDSYIGSGPGAVSTIAKRDGSSLRIEEPKSVEGYGVREQGGAAETQLPLSEAAFETVMMAFRTSFGLDLGSFYERFGIKAERLIGETLSAWTARLIPGELLATKDEPAALSRGPALDGRGLDILNRFLVNCLEEMDRYFLA